MNNNVWICVWKNILYILKCIKKNVSPKCLVTFTYALFAIKKYLRKKLIFFNENLTILYTMRNLSGVQVANDCTNQGLELEVYLRISTLRFFHRICILAALNIKNNFEYIYKTIRIFLFWPFSLVKLLGTIIIYYIV